MDGYALARRRRRSECRGRRARSRPTRGSLPATRDPARSDAPCAGGRQPQGRRWARLRSALLPAAEQRPEDAPDQVLASARRDHATARPDRIVDRALLCLGGVSLSLLLRLSLALGLFLRGGHLARLALDLGLLLRWRHRVHPRRS